MHVLIVEDERQLADSIAEGLRLHGMAVDVAYDGEAGLERAVSMITTYWRSTAVCPWFRAMRSVRGPGRRAAS